MKITTLTQLDQLINQGGGVIDPSVLSDEMRQALDMYSAGTKAMNQGALDEAIQIFSNATNMWPDFVAACVNLSTCLAQVREFQKALYYLDHAHRIAPCDPDIHISAGSVYDAMGNKQKELEQYYEALKDDPNHIYAKANLGATYRELGKLEESEQWICHAITEIEEQERLLAQLGWQHPAKPMLFLNLAETCEAAGNWSRAVYNWEQCLSLSPGDSFVQKRLEVARRQAQHHSSPCPQTADQLRAKIEGVFYHLHDQLGDRIKVDAYGALAQKQHNFSGHSYIDQLEKNVIYLDVLITQFEAAVARYLCTGEPILQRQDIENYINSTYVRPALSEIMPLHLRFVHQGCSSCSVHSQHIRYRMLRELRQSRNWSNYISELEPRYVFNRAAQQISEILIKVMLDNHQFAGIAQRVSYAETLKVIENRVSIHSSIWLGWYEASDST